MDYNILHPFLTPIRPRNYTQTFKTSVNHQYIAKPVYIPKNKSIINFR